jgi:hypothetical protein
VIERVEYAAYIEVVFKDCFGTGRLPAASEGVVVLPCTWQLQ